MKKFFTFLLLGLCSAAWPAVAQEIDESFVFVDENGEVIADGSTVVRSVVEIEDDGSEVIYSGVSVKNTNGSNDQLKVYYEIERLDNGIYQICFPTTCNMQDEIGSYETGIGALMGNMQNIQSEWFPEADGECIVNLSIELFAKQGLFPPTYVHKAYGPSITLRFVKGSAGKPGDVNNDGEVNIADVNAVIDMILSEPEEKGDVNNDGEVNIADVNAVIDIILS